MQRPSDERDLLVEDRRSRRVRVTDRAVEGLQRLEDDREQRTRVTRVEVELRELVQPGEVELRAVVAGELGEVVPVEAGVRRDTVEESGSGARHRCVDAAGGADLRAERQQAARIVQQLVHDLAERHVVAGVLQTDGQHVLGGVGCAGAVGAARLALADLDLALELDLQESRVGEDVGVRGHREVGAEQRGVVRRAQQHAVGTGRCGGQHARAAVGVVGHVDRRVGRDRRLEVEHEGDGRVVARRHLRGRVHGVDTGRALATGLESVAELDHADVALHARDGVRRVGRRQVRLRGPAVRVERDAVRVVRGDGACRVARHHVAVLELVRLPGLVRIAQAGR